MDVGRRWYFARGAIVATFFWFGSTNIIDSVTDVMTTSQASTGSVNPQWTWVFDSAPSSWMATVLALKPAGQ